MEKQVLRFSYCWRRFRQSALKCGGGNTIECFLVFACVGVVISHTDDRFLLPVISLLSCGITDLALLLSLDLKQLDHFFLVQTIYLPSTTFDLDLFCLFLLLCLFIRFKGVISIFVSLHFLFLIFKSASFSVTSLTRCAMLNHPTRSLAPSKLKVKDRLLLRNVL